MKLLIATRNQNKRREFESLLGEVFPEQVEFIDVANWPVELPDVIEDRDTFIGNAVKKAVEMSEQTGTCAMSEDSGLVVDALGGAPGVFSARFSGENATSARNNALLVERLRDVPEDERSARYMATICLAMIPGDPLGDFFIEAIGGEVRDGVPAEFGVLGREGDRVIALWQGRVEGQIVLDARGDGGFGYDPHFLVPEWGETMAQVSAERKNSISHRGRALRALRDSITSA